MLILPLLAVASAVPFSAAVGPHLDRRFQARPGGGSDGRPADQAFRVL
jgi:hypothetical protein